MVVTALAIFYGAWEIPSRKTSLANCLCCWISIFCRNGLLFTKPNVENTLTLKLTMVLALARMLLFNCFLRATTPLKQITFWKLKKIGKFATVTIFRLRDSYLYD